MPASLPSSAERAGSGPTYTVGQRVEKWTGGYNAVGEIRCAYQPDRDEHGNGRGPWQYMMAINRITRGRILHTLTDAQLRPEDAATPVDRNGSATERRDGPKLAQDVAFAIRVAIFEGDGGPDAISEAAVGAATRVIADHFIQPRFARPATDPAPGVQGASSGSRERGSQAVPALSGFDPARRWHCTERDGKPRRNAEHGERWLLTWSDASATADIACIDGEWGHGDEISLLGMDWWSWLDEPPHESVSDSVKAAETETARVYKPPHGVGPGLYTPRQVAHFGRVLQQPGMILYLEMTEGPYPGTTVHTRESTVEIGRSIELAAEGVAPTTGDDPSRADWIWDDTVAIRASVADPSDGVAPPPDTAEAAETGRGETLPRELADQCCLDAAAAIEGIAQELDAYGRTAQGHMLRCALDVLLAAQPEAPLPPADASTKRIRERAWARFQAGVASAGEAGTAETEGLGSRARDPGGVTPLPSTPPVPEASDLEGLAKALDAKADARQRSREMSRAAGHIDFADAHANASSAYSDAASMVRALPPRTDGGAAAQEVLALSSDDIVALVQGIWPIQTAILRAGQNASDNLLIKPDHSLTVGDLRRAIKPVLAICNKATEGVILRYAKAAPPASTEDGSAGA